jgi:fermentation-respiration switch protein FrsA (DUF1100 family)
MNNLLYMLLIALLLYAVLAAYVFLMQPRLIYYPDLPGRDIEVAPDAIGLEYEDVRLRTVDGEVLHGWFVPHRVPVATLLFCHGNAGNISHRLDSIRLFHELGLNVLIFDYRGYGQSTGRPTEQGTYRDVDAAWNYLVGERGIEPGAIILFGRSLGAAVIADLATRTRPAAVILESAFTSVPDLAARIYPWLPVRWLARYRYNNAGKIRAIAAPVLVIHSREDEIIPFSHAEQLFELANEPRQMLELSGGHNDAFYVSRELYRPAVEAFVRGSLASDQPSRAPGSRSFDGRLLD